MVQVRTRRRRIRSAAIALTFLATLAGLAACKPPAGGGGGSAQEELQQARKSYSRAVERIFREAGPVTDRGALAARLKLSPARFAVIGTGAGGNTGANFVAKVDCNEKRCRCVGEEDCNEMFKGVCSSPSTGGWCDVSRDIPVCICRIKQEPLPDDL